MSDRPRVSVIISTYNRSEKLKRAVESVLAQTLLDFELIIVDNASDDQTADVIKSFKDQRLIYIRHPRNLGGSAARNTGIRTAQAEFIALLDDDDAWMPSKLSAQYQKMQEVPSTVGLIYCGAEIVDEKTGQVITINLPQYKGNVYQRLLLSTILSSVSSVLIRRECFDRCGVFDEELTSCQDWDVWLRIAQQYEFDFVEEVLTRINMHGNQISTNYAALIPGRTRMIQKHRVEFAQYPAIYVVHLKRMGKLHCINGTWGKAWGWFSQAVALRPWEIIKIIAWFIIELPRVKFFSSAKSFQRYRAV